MTPVATFGANRWEAIDLVVFDVDGTLYDQPTLRWFMARDLLLFTMRSMDLKTLRTVRAFRRLRDRLAEEEVGDFHSLLIGETARLMGIPPEELEELVAEWIERSPLQYLTTCRAPGVGALFAGLRRSGKMIGVLSDYPARDKLRVLGLEAQYVVCAGDAGVSRMKPHPEGLISLTSAAGVPPARTLMIGDRVDRDGAAAERAGVQFLIRCMHPQRAKFPAFARFDDALFSPLLA